MKLHRMTWGELSKHGGAAINPYVDPKTIIPETYWFESNGQWYEVSRGYVGWFLLDENGDEAGFYETIRDLRNDKSFQ